MIIAFQAMWPISPKWKNAHVLSIVSQKGSQVSHSSNRITTVSWIDRQQLGQLTASVLIGIALLLVTSFMVSESTKTRLVVQPGESLISDLGYERAIAFAEHTGLPIYVTDQHNVTLHVDPTSALNDSNGAYRIAIPVEVGAIVDTRFGDHYMPPNH